MTLELDDIQGVLAGYPRLSYVRYLFLRFATARKAQSWLGGVAAPEITSARQRNDQCTTTLNLAFTWPGLAALEIAPETLDSFPEEFRVGMAGRATELGDADVNHRRNWEPNGPGTTLVHAVAIVYAATPELLDQRCQQVRDGFAGVGEIVTSQDGNRLQDPPAGEAKPAKPWFREHFGFRDGLAQPILEGFKEDVSALVEGQGVLQHNGKWRALRAGEIVLGYPDEEGVSSTSLTPPELARNGSYLVYRKLRQDVAAFRRLIAEQARHYPGGADELAAKMVGRTPDGRPLAAAAQHPTATGDDARRAFTYRDDLDGRTCPIGSHIRRVNPRDGVEARDRMVHRHRMLRRGIPYGPPLPAGVLDDDGQERGLLFVCLCASISRQFEFVQGQWVHDGNGLGQGSDQDPLLSNSSQGTNLTIPGRRPYFVSPIPALVTVCGGEYFFLPGRRALTYLAAPCHGERAVSL